MSHYIFFTDNYLALIIGVFFSIVGVAIFSTRLKLLSTRAELAKAEAQRQAQQKLLLETELKLLQAQIEPHFLFNTPLQHCRTDSPDSRGSRTKSAEFNHSASLFTAEHA